MLDHMMWVVQLELEDVLPWPEFSLRLPQYMMYRLPEALMDIMMEPGKVWGLIGDT
jgi:hypothetical protein